MDLQRSYTSSMSETPRLIPKILFSCNAPEAGAKIPLPEAVPQEWMKGELDPPFYNGHKPKQHPAVVDDKVVEGVLGAVQPNLYVGCNPVLSPKSSYGMFAF